MLAVLALEEDPSAIAAEGRREVARVRHQIARRRAAVDGADPQAGVALGAGEHRAVARDREAHGLEVAERKTSRGPGLRAIDLPEMDALAAIGLEHHARRAR